MATVIVPYQDWIGYNILKYLSGYPIESAAVIAAIAGLIAYYGAEHDPQAIAQKDLPNPLHVALITFAVVGAIVYAILWYYGTTLFKAS